MSEPDGVHVPVVVSATGQPIEPTRWPDRRLLHAEGLPGVDTTLRHILLSSIAVGRPVLGLLLTHPESAISELRVRVESIRSGLVLHRLLSGTQVAAISGWLAQSADPTERAAFGYRIGMAMADWATVQMLGVAHTRHVSGLVPEDPRRGGRGDPDLYGQHRWAGPKQWVIEAKGGTRVTARSRWEGADQLDTGWGTPHIQALVSASVAPHLHLLVELGLPLSGRGPAGLRDVGLWPLRDDARSPVHDIDAFLRRALLASVLGSHSARISTLDDRMVRLIDLEGLDASVGMWESAFEETAATLDAIRARLLPSRDSSTPAPHTLLAMATPMIRRLLPASGDTGALRGDVELFSLDRAVNGAIGREGSILILGPSWTEAR